MPKLLIMDKSFFQAVPADKLQEFVKKHSIILSDDLYAECATTLKNRDRLLERFRSCIFNGAYICASCVKIIKTEAQTLVHYGSLLKMSEVDAVKNTFLQNPTPYSPDVAEYLFRRDLDAARNLQAIS